MMIYLYIFILLFSIYFAYRLQKKIAGNNNFSLLMFIFSFIIISIINLLFTTFSIDYGSKYFHLFSNKNIVINAKVVAIDTQLSKRNNQTNYYYTYSPIVEFKDRENKIIRKPTNLYSTKVPKIGEYIKVSFGNEKSENVEDLSLMSNILLSLGILFLGGLIAMDYMIIAYTYSIDIKKRYKIAKKMLLIAFIISVLHFIIRYFYFK